MSTPIALTAERFLELFTGMLGAGYLSPVFLSDTRVGFSVQREYPKDIRFKPAKNNKGEPDDIAVIWVIYDETRKKEADDRVPIRIRVGTMSRYRAKHWDYNFEDDDGPTKESVQTSRKTPQPLEVNFFDEYFYDTGKSVFINSSGAELSGVQILNAVFKLHCDSVHPILGLGLRSRKTASETVFRIIEFVVAGLTWTLRNVFGRTLDDSFSRLGYFDGFLKENFKKIAVDSIEIFGYRASRRVILLFCAFVVFGAFFALPPSRGSYVESLLNSEFLLLVHGLLLIYFLDELLPGVIFFLLNKVVQLRRIYFNWLFTR
jgi:hypothetical protein